MKKAYERNIRAVKIYTKPRLFVDMDGTLAEWRQINIVVKSQEEATEKEVANRLNQILYSPGYFSSLEPHYEVVRAIKSLISSNEIEVYILSCVLPDKDGISPLDQKNKWLDKYLAEVDSSHRIFVPDGEDKKKYVPGGIKENDTLLDDFTKNLEKWAEIGKSIKLLNGINFRNKTWRGSRVAYNDTSLKNCLMDAVLNGKNISHNPPCPQNKVMTDEEFLGQSNYDISER